MRSISRWDEWSNIVWDVCIVTEHQTIPLVIWWIVFCSWLSAKCLLTLYLTLSEAVQYAPTAVANEMMMKSRDQIYCCYPLVCMLGKIVIVRRQMRFLQSRDCGWQWNQLQQKVNIQIPQPALSLCLLLILYVCRGVGWGVREAGWKPGWRATSQRLL